MRLLKALDRAFTTFVNEIFPFPVFPSLDQVADEIVRREELEEVWEPRLQPLEDVMWPWGKCFDGEPNAERARAEQSSSASGVAGETPVGGEQSPAPSDGHSKADKYVLFGCAADIYDIAAGTRVFNGASLVAIANRIEAIAMK